MRGGGRLGRGISRGVSKESETVVPKFNYFVYFSGASVKMVV